MLFGSQKTERFLLCVLFACLLRTAHAYDLNQVKIERLDNGLTVMILEDHAQPLVSTQVLYKVGARNECTGTTGLAHFVEHMAFRSTKNFPDTQGAIYSIGGEWHGYTWIDQTTYFETVPVEQLDTALRLQADRMVNVVNRKEEVEAEKGAVLTELHSYENDPASILFDKVLALSFLEHPYRFNTVGWTSDVENISHADLVHFYERYYTPFNAVLAIAGDVQAGEVLNQVKKHFGPLTGKQIDTLPRTIEPPQEGERRIQVKGAGKLNYFQISYRAPAATDSDYPAFLLMQGILAGSNGVSFHQSGFGVRIPENVRLAGIGNKITSFFAATAQPYVFNISGNTDSAPAAIEIEIEKRISVLRDQAVPLQELTEARKQLIEELVFDIETTEDAAHQMAYFEGINAFPVLQRLPSLLQAVTANDIQRIARKYLRPEQRTIGWYLGQSSASAQTPSRSTLAARKEDVARTLTLTNRSTDPLVRKTRNGLTLIVQRMARTPAAFLRILVPSVSVETNAASSANDPVWGHTSLHWRFLQEDLTATLQKAKEAVTKIRAGEPVDPSETDDPETRLDIELEDLVNANLSGGNLKPGVISIVGDVDPVNTMQMLEKTFGGFSGNAHNAPRSSVILREKIKTVRLPGKAQSQFGYAVPAPAPAAGDSYAYKALLYILTHGYGGRLGKELINNRGVIYYIGSNYHSDGDASWISMRFGVNPDKLVESKKLFDQILQGLLTNPPTEQELAEAKRHLIGRRVTAYQSNEQLSAFYAREWVEQRRIPTQSEFKQKMNAVTLSEVKKIIPAFIAGAQVLIDTNP